ncbi:DUF397 domain-containing protein [Streptomyces sp. GXMU-J5]|uniref:DUF397 domain-containing protein n=2 Tax=Streptomyces beihaiensis TaxID=2984495 RepID=A0ABT3TTV2_9ACTN|nr:DUF397 domain-containing protein [Streptomyces beihaiensis]
MPTAREDHAGRRGRRRSGDPCELAWFKSSYSSGGSEPDRVEVAHTPGAVHVRGSKDTDRPHCTVGGAARAEFVTYAAQR